MHQPIKPRKNLEKIYKVVDILPEYLDMIKAGTKKMEFRRWYSEAPYFILRNTETSKTEAILEIGEVIDLNILDEESKETVLDEGKVTQEFRDEYDCRFCYTIEKVFKVH